MRRSLIVSLVGIVTVAVTALAATLLSGNSPRLGLDLQGGASVVLTPVKTTASGTLDQAVKIISRRVDALGVAEPQITRQGNNIVVELPGVKDASTAVQVVGQTAELQFRPVLATYAGPGPAPAVTSGPTSTTAPGTSTPPASSVPTTTAPTGATPTTPAPPAGTTPTTKGALSAGSRVAAAALGAAVPVAAPPPSAPTAASAAPTAASAAPTAASAVPTAGATGASSPAPGGTTAATVAPGTTGQPAAPTATDTTGPPLTPTSQITDTATVVLPHYAKDGTIDSRYVCGPVVLTGNIVSGANTQVDSAGQWSVLVNFTGKGGNEFDSQIAKPYYQKQVAIVLDNKVESAPTINAQQFNGQATISGGAAGFSHKEASNLALVLRYGALPVQLTQSDVQTVSPSLGRDSLRAGLIAGLIGLALVLVYMLFYYRALGVVVILGLSVSAALLYSIVTYLGQSSLHQSLSLAGVVGIIVSVGVTVDSYIVYFERLKDDIRAGKSVRATVDRSFGRAWRTIWTADLVSMIAAALLFWLTIGAVRGFAFFLGLATLLDLAVTYFFTRPMVVLLGRNRTFTEARFFGVARGLAATPAGGAG